MNKPYTFAGGAILLGLAFLGASCGKNIGKTNVQAQGAAARITTVVDSACASTVFTLGRPVPMNELQGYGATKFSLESISFRDVLYKNPSEVEIAYRTEMKMRLSPDRFLVPEHTMECHEENKPSKRAQTLSRTMIPVLGDLHLPSGRITIFDTSEPGGMEDRDRLYNYPRISEISISSGGYFSFNQNWAPYRKVQNLVQYMEILKSRALYTKVEVREMGYGRLAIYAEKDISGERAQLLISLTESH